MDFDIDSFLNETFKKVEKKDKKRNNESKSIDKQENLEINEIEIQNDFKKTEMRTQQAIINNNSKLISSNPQKTLISGDSSNINSMPIIIQNEKKNQKLLSSKTQRIFQEKSSISDKKGKLKCHSLY